MIIALNGISIFQGSDWKWGISFNDWPWKEYPSYVSGGTVLMTGNSLGPLLAAFQTTPFSRIDDAYLGGICTEKANIPVYFSPRYLFVFKKITIH